MTMLADWLYTLGTTGAAWFWGPLVAWTLVAIPVYLGLRMWTSAPALVQYRVHLALLLALPLSLLLTPLMPVSLISLPVAEPLPVVALEAPLPPLSFGEVLPALPASPALEATLWTPFHLIGIATLIALGMGVFLLARVAFLALQLRRYRASLTPLLSDQVHDQARLLADEVGVAEPVTLLLAPAQTTPMTFGWRQPVIVLPADLLEDDAALRMTLVHELIHVRRRDYAVSWAVRLVGCLFAVHPGVWVLSRRIEQYRELSCDAEALAERRVPPRPYAELLLRFSPLTDPAGPMALRMVELDATLKQRLKAMKTALTNSPHLLRWSLPLAAIALLIPALLAACSANFSNTETVTVGEAPPPPPVPADAPLPPFEVSVEAGETVVRPGLEADIMEKAQRAYEQAIARADQAASQVEGELALHKFHEAHQLLVEASRAASQIDQEQLQQRIVEAQARVQEMQARMARQQAEEDLAQEQSIRVGEATFDRESIQRLIKNLLARSQAEEARRQVAGGHLQQELERLQVQMAYLEQELVKLEEEIQALPRSELSTEEKNRKIPRLRQRQELLQNMYSQRLEAYETLKMEVYANEMLAKQE